MISKLSGKCLKWVNTCKIIMSWWMGFECDGGEVGRIWGAERVLWVELFEMGFLGGASDTQSTYKNYFSKPHSGTPKTTPAYRYLPLFWWNLTIFGQDKVPFLINLSNRLWYVVWFSVGIWGVGRFMDVGYRCWWRIWGWAAVTARKFEIVVPSPISPPPNNNPFLKIVLKILYFGNYCLFLKSFS